jgi:uncharacterized protein (DUF58 family)
MARVRAIEIRTHKLVNTALSGGYRSSFRGQGIEFQEVRAYQPGDDVRRIDWNVTARTGDAFVKNYAEERELTVQLIVDSSRSMDLGSAEWTKREVAAQFAALIAFVGLRHGDRVGLTLFGEQPGLHLPPRKAASMCCASCARCWRRVHRRRAAIWARRWSVKSGSCAGAAWCSWSATFSPTASPDPNGSQR